MTDAVQYLDCANCGGELRGAHPTPGWYSDGETLACPDCGATNHVSCDSETEPYVGSWECIHGKAGDEPCDACEDETP